MRVNFFRFGALCCVYYIAAQLIQWVTFYHGINATATGVAEIVQHGTWLDQFRQWLILLSFTLIPILAAYAGVAVQRFRKRPAASLLGFAFACLFVGTEAAIRSVDLFLISWRWVPEYNSAASEAIRQAVVARVQIWDDAVSALYFALLGADMLASISFAVATWDTDDRWNRIVAVGFAANALECASRLASDYFGQTWLGAANYVAYFPIVILAYGSLSVWLWRQTGPVTVSGPADTARAG